MITKADCPSKAADPYPGKRGRNTPTGSVLTRKQFIEKQVEDWINHFDDSEEYQNELVSRKAVYLVRHLKVFKIPYKSALKLLVEVESRQKENDIEDNSQQQIQNEGMEEDEDDGNNVQPQETQSDQNIDNFDMLDVDQASDVDMFSEDDSEQNDQKRVKTDLELAKILTKTDEELFEGGLQVSDKIKRSLKYIDRKERYVEGKLEGLSSQEILSTYSQNPVFVQESNAMKNRLKHLAKQEKANKTVLKAIQDTINTLQKTPGPVAKDQVKVITAAATHHRYGVPDIPQISGRTSKAAKKMKIDFLQGKDSILTPAMKAKRQIYPKELEVLAVKHWNENTTLEPALHRRKAVSDDKETIPTRYQSLTDREQFSLFKEDCAGEMVDILTRYSSAEIAKLTKRPDSDDKKQRMAYFENLSAKVPSMDWYLNLKPLEVKLMHDHTTALCKTCEANLLNYNTLYKAIKLQCRCTTTSCPNWMCLCDWDDDEDQGQCHCKCACEDCKKCKVFLIYNCNVL